MAELTVKELTPETWADFEAFFGKYHGVRGGCWCAFHLCGSSQFYKMSREEHHDYHRALVEQGRASGVLVYDAGEPVAWCQLGRAEDMASYDRGRAYQALTLPAELRPQWRISCIFVDKRRRRERLSTYALRAALELIRQRGGGIVEAFPLDVPGAERPSYTGLVRQYAREGFETVARLGKVVVLMRKRVEVDV